MLCMYFLEDDQGRGSWPYGKASPMDPGCPMTSLVPDLIQPFDNSASLKDLHNYFQPSTNSNPSILSNSSQGRSV